MEHVGGDFRHAALAGCFHQLLVDGLQFLGSFLDARFEVVARGLQRGIALLNLRQHFVEAVNQDSDFIRTAFDRANGIIFLLRHGADRSHQI
jgi:hypothetical protein